MYITRNKLSKMASEVLEFLDSTGINEPKDFENALGVYSLSGCKAEISVRKYKTNGGPCSYVLGIREYYGNPDSDIISIVLSGVKGNTKIIARTNEILDNYSLDGILPVDGCGNIIQARESTTTEIKPVREELNRLARL